MARDPLSSVDSYTTFKGWALPVLKAHAGDDMDEKCEALYNECYTRSLHPAVPPKMVLRNRDLFYGMLSLCNGVGNHKVAAQSYGILNVAGCAMEYRRTLTETGIVLSNQALGASDDYLHVYALDDRDETVNWRVAANVVPVDIPEATRRIAQVMDHFANVGHFKATAPADAAKPDSVIVYMLKDGAYAATRDAVLNALAGLNIQETFAPMWDELSPGIAVAAEPPQVEGEGGSSFGTYRCLLTAMAFDYAVQTHAGGQAQNLTPLDFGGEVDIYFARYGVPNNAPHDQYQLVIGNQPQVPAARTAYVSQNQWDAYLRAYALSKGDPADTYIGQGVDNNPVII
ncbi:T3SS effector HopA1 family protein [Magnetovibrio sp.]|uniref:T3SS effector HopA1 family protein n=1 Tax=Magnetovibrio sp. TaxID=2024836 RepID=UPI002F948B25